MALGFANVDLSAPEAIRAPRCWPGQLRLAPLVETGWVKWRNSTFFSSSWAVGISA